MGAAPPRRGDQEFAGQVNSMFDRISGVYDRMNRVMTAGLDQAWRARAAERARLEPGMTALDLCCGTGDLTLELAGRVGPQGAVTGADFSRPMLELAREKAEGHGVPQARFEWADALDLPFEDEAFDAVTIAFGIRNVPDVPAALREMRRALRPGGRVLILEFSLPANAAVRGSYLLYFRHVLPRLGGMVSGDAAAYRYLNRTVETFPYGEAFCALMREAGFVAVEAHPLTFGIATLYVGARPEA